MLGGIRLWRGQYWAWCWCSHRDWRWRYTQSTQYTAAMPQQPNATVPCQSTSDTVTSQGTVSQSHQTTFRLLLTVVLCANNDQ